MLTVFVLFFVYDRDCRFSLYVCNGFTYITNGLQRAIQYIMSGIYLFKYSINCIIYHSLKKFSRIKCASLQDGTLFISQKKDRIREVPIQLYIPVCIKSRSQIYFCVQTMEVLGTTSLNSMVIRIYQQCLCEKMPSGTTVVCRLPNRWRLVRFLIISHSVLFT